MQNTVVISIDDLAQWIAPGGDLYGQVKTPNIDRLMSDSVTFSNAFTPVALCNPARTSVLSGQMPDTTGVHTNGQRWFEYVDPSETWMAQFLDAGATVGSFGKVFHGNMPASVSNQLFSDYLPLTGYFSGAPATEYVQPLPPELSEEDLSDEIAVDAAIDFLDGLGPNEEFMLNVGIVKPHTSWVVPQEYFDMYPLEDIVVPGLVGDDLSDVPAFILEQIPQGQTPATAEDAKLWMQGYLASVSYADYQIGRLLDEMQANGQYDDTNIVLWSDHGYHLGDHDGVWHKFTLWEEATRAPLVIKGAGNPNAGAVVDDVVSLVDIYPTLTDLAGLPAPAHLEGDSLAPLVLGTGPAEGDGMAITWMYGSAMLRSDTIAFIHYEDGSEELYDIIADPRQKVNLIDNPAYGPTADYMRAQLFEKASLFDVDGAPVQGTNGVDTFLLSDPGDGAIGGGGDDLYFVNASRVAIREIAGGGIDTVFTDVDYKLPDHVENLWTKVKTSGAITVEGNALDNRITLEGDNQRAYLGAGNDRGSTTHTGSAIYGQDGDDYITGGRGDDTFDGGNGNDILNGGPGGIDLLLGGNGNDRLIGGDGASKLAGGNGNDALLGGTGDETLLGGAGADDINGGGGYDRAGFWLAGAGVTADLMNMVRGTGEAEGDVFTSVEGIIGSVHADMLFGTRGNNDMRGNAGNDWLFGRGGSDTLVGGDGDDVLLGGAGPDRLQGGEGRDIAGYMDGISGVVADLAGHVAGEGNARGDTYDSIESLHGSNYNDLLYGDDGDNQISGREGSDRITGRGGNDVLTGGGGRDFFVFYANSGRDVVMDFEIGVDRLVLKGKGFTSLSEALDAFVQQGDNAVLETGADRLTLLGIDINDLTINDILI